LSARRTRTLLTAAALVVAVASHARSQDRPAPLELLDVPYLSQSEALCGGAAAAMVMRYWGAKGVYAESFSDLVTAGAGGIRGEDLLRALQDRGWDVRSFRGDAALARSHLARRRPVVALIEDRPGRFHYVVVVAWPEGRVLLHDPARAPFRVMAEAEFVRAWEAAGSWTMLVLPGTGAAAPPAAAGESGPVAGAAAPPCAAMIDEGVRIAGAGEMDAAARLFELSAAACPRASGPWREMAGLHALRREWREAGRDARRAITLDPADQHAWRILATATFLDGDPRSALGAWNRIGEPRVDLVEVKGLDRTRYDVVAGAVAIPPQSILTAAAVDRARRRLEELPSVQTSRVVYRPAENGQANVDVVVFERPMLPTTPPALMAVGVRALSDRELSVALSSPTGGGEVWNVAWRWWDERPRVGIGFSAPVRPGGVLRLDVFDERQAYGLGDTSFDERRRGAAIAFADWLRGDTRWDAGLGVDRWRDRGRSGSVGAGLERHLANGAVVLSTGGEAWFGRVSTWTARAGAHWRSSRTREGNEWSARAGMHLTGRRAPFALWHGAGTGPRATALLRAHPVLDGGRVDRAVFGRRLFHAGAEWRHWLPPVKRVVRIAPAIFVDAGHALDGAAFSDPRAHVDVGAGLRVVLPGSGVVGIDVGRGLRDGQMALSIGWRR
jgi:Peptidase C39 family